MGLLEIRARARGRAPATQALLPNPATRAHLTREINWQRATQFAAHLEDCQVLGATVDVDSVTKPGMINVPTHFYVNRAVRARAGTGTLPDARAHKLLGAGCPCTRAAGYMPLWG